MPVDSHLCQPGGGASCGACCGLYNFADHSRQALTEELNRHTDALAGAPHDRQAWSAVGAKLVRERAAAPLFEKVRVCPLLGFLDDEKTRVGCLAHPLVTGGPDLRDCGVYTAEICEGFTCPSFSWLDEAHAQLVRAACPDWYLYGLVITDVEFVRGCLRLLENARAAPVPLARLRSEPGALDAVRRLFSLKERMPDRATSGTVFGRFVEVGADEPALRTIDYRGLGVTAAPEDELVLCLGVAPFTSQGLQAGREVVRAHVDAIVGALDSVSSHTGCTG